MSGNTIKSYGNIGDVFGIPLTKNQNFYCGITQNKNFFNANFKTCIIGTIFKTLCGYIPVAGIFSYWARQCVVMPAVEERLNQGGCELNPMLKLAVKIRSIIECIGLGIVFLIPDIVATIVRAIRKPVSEPKVVQVPESQTLFNNI